MTGIGWRGLFGRLADLGAGAAGSARSGRVTGKPPSGNGASSFHLIWEVPPVPLVEVTATLEVREPPTVDELYFWALQVSFHRDGRRVGGAHTGLQFNPRFPDRRALNWGGYNDRGGVLEGSVSPLPSSPDDVNTRDYPWQPGRRYRLAVRPSPERGWRATITDLDRPEDSAGGTGPETVIRDLWVEADCLMAPMVWSEVFAHCDHPGVAVRWTDLRAVTATGDEVRPRALRCNYQTHVDGGCANTDSSFDGDGYVQRTATVRRNRTATLLAIPDHT